MTRWKGGSLRRPALHAPVLQVCLRDHLEGPVRASIVHEDHLPARADLPFEDGEQCFEQMRQRLLFVEARDDQGELNRVGHSCAVVLGSAIRPSKEFLHLRTRGARREGILN